MNTKQLNVRFTFEIENRNNFSFLDINIIRNTEKKLLKDQFTVYRKSAFSGVFTNCKSFITMAQKIQLSENVILLFFKMLFLQKVPRENCQG